MPGLSETGDNLNASDKVLCDKVMKMHNILCVGFVIVYP